MNCEKCGAPLKGDEELCPYCGSLTKYGEKLQKQAEEARQAELRRGRPDNLPQLKYASVGMLILLTIITCGFYGFYWYTSRRGTLNQLADGLKFPDIGFILYVAGFVSMFFIPQQEENLMGIAWLISAVGAVWLAFGVKKILKTYALKHLGGTVGASLIASSDVAAFFFGYLYLQSQINKMIELAIINPKI